MPRFVAAPGRRAGLLLLALAVFMASWDLWVLAMDRSFGGSDTFMPAVAHLYWALYGQGGEAWRAAVGPKGPLGPALGLFLLVLVRSLSTASRLVSVLCHIALIFQCNDLGRRLGNSTRAGLWAALICAASPLVFGWCRLPHYDALCAVMVMACLQVLVRLGLDRTRAVVLAGVVLALGLMSKPSFVVFMLFPGLWFLLTRVRSLRAAWQLGLLLLSVLLVAAPWLFLVGQELLVTYPRMATQGLTHKGIPQVVYYYGHLPGLREVVAGALVSTALLGWRRAADGWLLCCLTGMVLVSLSLHLLVFDAWSRYLVPLVPPAAVVAGTGLSWSLDHIRLPGWRRTVAWSLAALLLGHFVGLNLYGYEDRPSRGQGMGLVQPDLRSYRGFPSAAGVLLRFGREMLLTADSRGAKASGAGMVNLWQSRGLPVKEVDLGYARNLAGQRRPVLSVVVFRQYPDLPLEQVKQERRDQTNRRQVMEWLLSRSRRHRLWTSMDPDGLVYQSFRVNPWPAARSSERPPAARPTGSAPPAAGPP